MMSVQYVRRASGAVQQVTWSAPAVVADEDGKRREVVVATPPPMAEGDVEIREVEPLEVVAAANGTAITAGEGD